MSKVHENIKREGEDFSIEAKTIFLDSDQIKAINLSHSVTIPMDQYHGISMIGI